jgi:hypothetical protein
MKNKFYFLFREQPPLPGGEYFRITKASCLLQLVSCSLKLGGFFVSAILKHFCILHYYFLFAIKRS